MRAIPVVRASMAVLAVLIALLFISCPAKEGTMAADAGGPPSAGPVILVSDQLNPAEEAAALRDRILGEFKGTVDFRPREGSMLAPETMAALVETPPRPVAIGGLHADFKDLWAAGLLAPLDGLYRKLESRGFVPALVDLARLDGSTMFYVPWMQASYVLAINRKALDYLPPGVDVRTITYDQLTAWGAAMIQVTGRRLVGFPAGDKGLMHRFLQGYLYPSFTGSTLVKFRSDDAVAMWERFRRLWDVVNPSSVTYSTMADPLLAEEVWVAWDHTARLTKAFRERPGDFMAVPAPIGPRGRGFMAVISGLGMAAGNAEADGAPAGGAEALVEYLTRPEVQRLTLAETGFFPVLKEGARADVPSPLDSLADAVVAQSAAPESVLTLLPTGLGARGGDYNKAFLLTFSDIVLGGRDIRATLDANAAVIQAIIDETGAPCWLPDVSDGKPCRLE